MASFSVRRFSGGEVERSTDLVAVEEPLAIFVKYWLKDSLLTANLAVTMRTPGFDKELAAGLLLSEGVIRAAADIAEVRVLGSGTAANEILVELARGVDFEGWRFARDGFASSSCGVCGRRSSAAIAQDLPKAGGDDFRVRAQVLCELPAALRSRQPGFLETGGLHAAALATAGGEIEAAFEDIGRHNALDKAIGWALLGGRIPLRERLVFLSSRGTFELVQKTAMAGSPMLATVGSASSLAIETARDLQITLAGFVRGGRCSVYSGEWRINS